MVYKKFGSERIEEVKCLFKEEGWNAYLQNDRALVRAFDNSLFCYGAFDDNDRMIAFIRLVGDGEHIVLIQDLIVNKEYRRRGIGRNLVKKVFDTYSNVRMIQVNTDIEDEADNSFYKAMGMKPVAEGYMISYFR